jgi:NAD(P)-dependent dehydrogenase (short-subunit alcohol dehydrogenase family)
MQPPGDAAAPRGDAGRAAQPDGVAGPGPRRHGRGTSWAEIAAAAGYLVSPAAAYVSGATIRVDGGTIRSVH